MELSHFNVASITHRKLKSARTGEQYSESAILSELAGLSQVFVHHEVIAPGRRASAPHTHSKQEEMIFVLEGAPTVHLGSQATQLQPGTFIGFSPSGDQPHYVENQTDSIARILVIASKTDADQVRFPGGPAQ